MENKRYAIVRVRYDNCPIKYMIPKTYKNRCILHNKNCEQCGRNGDTKEQLVAKVEQAIRRNVKNGVCLYTENNSIHTTDNRFFWNWVAKFIVEFLGVE